jgi:hypothetical protein
MSKKIESLTDAQKARFPEFVSKWTNIGLSTAPADRPRAERAIAEMYGAAGLTAPKRIVWCGSPLSQGLTRAIVLNADSVCDSVGDSVWDSVKVSVGDSVWDSVKVSVGDSVWDSVGASVKVSVGASVKVSVRTSVWDSVRDSVGDSVRDSVGDSVWASVRDSVRDSVWDSVGASVGASVRDSVWDSVRDSVGDSVGDSVWDSVYGAHDSGWLSFYDFFGEAVGLNTKNGKLHGLMELAKSAGWALPHREMCFVSERHNILRRDDLGRLHCENGPACAYPDGWSIFAWHGTRIPAEWIMDRKSLTPEIALKWENMEQRRAACEILGWDSILSQLKAKVINEDDDPQIGILVEVTIPDIGKEKFLRVLCGTGRWFALPVPKEMKTALDAQSWTWGLDKKSFVKPEIRT